MSLNQIDFSLLLCYHRCSRLHHQCLELVVRILVGISIPKLSCLPVPFISLQEAIPSHPPPPWVRMHTCMPFNVLFLLLLVCFAGPLSLAPPGILQAQQQGIYSPPSTGITQSPVQILGMCMHCLSLSAIGAVIVIHVGDLYMSALLCLYFCVDSAD